MEPKINLCFKLQGNVTETLNKLTHAYKEYFFILYTSYKKHKVFLITEIGQPVTA